MIFSAEKWNRGAELKAVMKVNTAISFEMMEAPLRNAWLQFIVPLLGQRMADEVIEIYRFGVNPETPVPGTGGPTEQEKLDWQLLQLCQRANANLAFFADFDEISVRITDAGFQRQKSENETFQQTYKYQEDNLRKSFRAKGFNALDSMLDFLYENLEAYPEFKESETFRKHQSAIVRSTADVDRVYSINRSRIVYLRLQPHIQFAEHQLLEPAIGKRLYDHLIDGLKKPSTNLQERENLERLRMSCVGYIVSMAIRRLMMETGSLTDRGLYFTSIESGNHGNEEIRPQTNERLAMQIANIKLDADTYMTSIQRVIQDYFTEFSVGNPQEVYRRDNDGKSTFWV